MSFSLDKFILLTSQPPRFNNWCHHFGAREMIHREPNVMGNLIHEKFILNRRRVREHVKGFNTPVLTTRSPGLLRKRSKWPRVGSSLRKGKDSLSLWKH